MLDRIKLIDVILDNQSSSDVDLVKALESFIATGKPYDHSLKDSLDCCGITKPGKEVEDKLKQKTNSISEEVELIESIFTKRETSYMIVTSKIRVNKLEEALNEIMKMIGDKNDE